jgi:hypothetical protein
VKNTQTCHFWLGRFPNGQSTARYFAEVWDEYDEDREHTPLSEFARGQGQKWYDHDFLEYGFKADASSVEELVKGYSYHGQYAAELSRRASAAGLDGLNMFVFIDEEQIDRPRSVEGKGYALYYLGTVKYRI